MHSIQKAILALFGENDEMPLKLRHIGREIWEEHPQKIKYHLGQLESNGLVSVDEERMVVTRRVGTTNSQWVASLPFMGWASCGPATAWADNEVIFTMQVSKSLLPSGATDSFFVLRANGNSMNKANIHGSNIEEDDFVIIQRTTEAQHGDYVVSIIDWCANIKRLHVRSDSLALISESTSDYPPMFISPEDDCLIIGKAVRVLKAPGF